MLLNRSWGARGHPFAQHYSCPAFLDAQLVLQVAAVGIFFRMWSIASIAQGQALRSIGKAATSVLPPFTPMCFFFQNECASYAGRSGRTSLCSRRSAGREFLQLQKQTCQKLWPLSALEFEARLLLPSSSSKIKMSRTVRLRRTTWFPSANQFTESSVQTAFKSCGCFATALVWKAVFTPNWFCLMSPLSRRRDDF